jgi:hypothetical protein
MKFIPHTLLKDIVSYQAVLYETDQPIMKR